MFPQAIGEGKPKEASMRDPKKRTAGAAAGLLVLQLTAALPAVAAIAGAGSVSSGAPSRDGVHGFDFEIGDWRVHHRLKRPADGGRWSEFEGTCVARPFMEGAGILEAHRFERPTGVTHGIAVRAFDAGTGEWAIWWIDSRNPHGPLDPPMKGRFENGVGTFYGDGSLDGKPMRTRFLWTHPTDDTAHWEQAFSFDAGKTWDTNWIMDLRRTAR